MKPESNSVYRASEFAALACVTVRALPHYDRLGRLRPKQRSQAVIVVLKFLGIPLKQIRRLLEPDAKLADVLQKQCDVLLTKRLQLDKTIRAISNAQRSLASKKQPDGKLFQFIVQEFEMQKNTEWKGKYFSAEARAKVAARRGQLTSEELEKAHTAWAEFTRCTSFASRRSGGAKCTSACGSR